MPENTERQKLNERKYNGNDDKERKKYTQTKIDKICVLSAEKKEEAKEGLKWRTQSMANTKIHRNES